MNIRPLIFAAMSMFYLGCSNSNSGPHLNSTELAKDDSGTWTVLQLETKVKMLEQKIAEHDEFIKKAKEVLASHRARIVQQDNQFKVMTDPRFAPKPIAGKDRETEKSKSKN